MSNSTRIFVATLEQKGNEFFIHASVFQEVQLLSGRPRRRKIAEAGVFGPYPSSEAAQQDANHFIQYGERPEAPLVSRSQLN